MNPSECPLYASSPLRPSPYLQRPSYTSPTRICPALSSSPSSCSSSQLSPSQFPISPSSPLKLSPSFQPVSSSPCPTRPSPLSFSSAAIRLSACPQPVHSSPTRLSPCPCKIASQRPTSLSPCSIPHSSPVIPKKPINISPFSGHPDPSPILRIHTRSCISKPAPVTEGPDHTRHSFPTNQTPVQTTVHSDNELDNLAVPSYSERMAKSIPIPKSRIQTKQRQQQLQDMYREDISSEDKPVRDIVTKKEGMSRQNLKPIGRGTQSLALYKRKPRTLDPVLTQARLGLNKTKKADSDHGSRLLFDNLNQDSFKWAKSEAGHETSGLTNIPHRNKTPLKQLPGFKIFAPAEQSKTTASSSSSKILHLNQEIHFSPIARFSSDINHINNVSSLLHSAQNHRSTRPSMPRSTPSEKDTCISTISQTGQTDCTRFPFTSHESSAGHVTKISRTESETTTTNYIHTPRQLNRTDRDALKSRTCRRVMAGAASCPDKKSTYPTSTQARKKDSSSLETGKKRAPKKDVHKPSQKSHRGSGTDSSRSNSSGTSSLEDGTHVRKRNGLQLQVKCAISCRKQTRDDAEMQTTSHNLPQSATPHDLYTPSALHTPKEEESLTVVSEEIIPFGVYECQREYKPRRSGINTYEHC